jgi:hypothetical protein
MAEALIRFGGDQVMFLWTDTNRPGCGLENMEVEGVLFLDLDPDWPNGHTSWSAAPSFHVYSATYQGWPLADLAEWHLIRGSSYAFERITPSLGKPGRAKGCILPPELPLGYDPETPFGRTPRPSLGVQMELCAHESIREMQREYLAPSHREFDLLFLLESKTHVDLAGRVRGLWGWYAPRPVLPDFPCWSFEMSRALFAGARIFCHMAPPCMEDYVIRVSDMNELEKGLLQPFSSKPADHDLYERIARYFCRQAHVAMFGEHAWDCK